MNTRTNNLCDKFGEKDFYSSLSQVLCPTYSLFFEPTHTPITERVYLPAHAQVLTVVPLLWRTSYSIKLFASTCLVCCIIHFALTFTVVFMCTFAVEGTEAAGDRQSLIVEHERQNVFIRVTLVSWRGVCSHIDRLLHNTRHYWLSQK